MGAVKVIKGGKKKAGAVRKATRRVSSSPSPLKKVALDAESTRLRILEAAIREFAANGFAGGRMEAIAKNAKINKAMLHYYFRSKKNLYMTVLKRIFSADEEKAVPIDLSSYDLSPAQKLSLLLDIITEKHFSHMHSEFHQIMAWEMAEGRTHLKVIARDYFIPRIRLIENLIREGVKKGEFDTEDPLLAVFCILNFFIGHGMQKDTFAGSEIEAPLYKGLTLEKMRSFAKIHFFKTLSPTASPDLPVIPADVLKDIRRKMDEHFDSVSMKSSNTTDRRKK